MEGVKDSLGYHGTPRSRDNRCHSSTVLEHKYILLVCMVLTFSAGRMCCFMKRFTLVRTSWPVLLCPNNCWEVSICDGVVPKVLYYKKQKKVTKVSKSLFYTSVYNVKTSPTLLKYPSGVAIFWNFLSFSYYGVNAEAPLSLNVTNVYFEC